MQDPNGSSDSKVVKLGKKANQDADGADQPSKPNAAGSTRKKKAKAAKSKMNAKTMSLPLGIGLCMLATLLGSAGGWVLPKIFDPENAAPARAIAANAKNLDAISTTLNQRAAQTETAVDTFKSNAQTQAGKLQLMANQLTNVEIQLGALSAVDHAAKRQEDIAPILDKVDALETLMSPEAIEEQQPSGRVSKLLERIAELEASVTELQANAESNNVLPIDAAMSEGADSLVAPALSPIYDLVDNFPSTAMIAALKAQSQNTEKPSWLRRMISKHVQTDDFTASESQAIIENAQRLIQQGEIDKAITAIESLNPTLRAAAHQWLIEAKKQR